MRKAPFVFALMLIFAHANAQKNLRKGLVVLKSGDTLQGWIDYRNWHTTPRVINFKKDSLSETPQSILSFRPRIISNNRFG